MEAINKDDFFDDELCGMVNFEDETEWPSKPLETKKSYAEEMVFDEKKTDCRGSKKIMDAEWKPVKVLYDIKLFNCVKWFLLFAGLEYLVFYWLQTGQMELSAAMPSMIVCAFLAGWSIKKNWKWRN